MNTKPTSVDEYISQSPSSTQMILKKIMNIITKNAPKAVESIAYGMPAYKHNKKPMVYFAAYPKHIGFYATPSGHEKFKEQLSSYKQGKGSVQFPLDEDMPYDLITEMVKFRYNELS